MLDSNISDCLLQRPDVVASIKRLVPAGKLSIVTTHVQRDEHKDIPDPKRTEIEALFIPLESTPTSASIWGRSEWGTASWGDGAGDIKLNDVMSKQGNHVRDALIASTAAAKCDALVTNDKRLSKRIRGTGSALIVWSFDEFAEWTSTA